MQTLCLAEWSDVSAGVPTQLDAGESEVIALSIELTDVLAVLDDKKARRVAHEMRLKVMGTIGHLLKCETARPTA